MLPVFSILSFLITPSVLSNVYINGGENRKVIKKGQSRDTDNIENTRHKTTKNKTKSKQSKKQNTTQKTKMMSGPQQKPGLNPSAHEGQVVRIR
jgi:hypothetical protein